VFVPGDPLWSIEKDAEDEEFVELSGAAALDEGAIVAGDHRTGLLHTISPSGQPTRRIGRRGSGPGELSALDGMGGSSGLGVWLFDASNQRIVLRDEAGELRDTKPIRYPTGLASWPMVVGLVSPDEIILVEKHRPVPMGQTPGSLLRDSTRITRLSLSTRTLFALGTFPLADIYVSPKGAGRIYGAPYGPALNAAPLPGGSGLLIGFSDSMKIWRLTADGQKSVILSRDLVAQTIPESIRKSSRTPKGRGRATDEDLPENFIPRRYPAFAKVLGDDRGGVWIQQYQVEEDRQPLWAVFNPDGILRGLVLLPPRFHLLLVLGDDIVGVHRSSDDVEVLQRLRLQSLR
jgi:hypothetical protein